MTDLKSWLDSKAYLTESIKPISSHIGPGFLVERSLTPSAEHQLCESITAPPREATTLKDGSRSLVCRYQLDERPFVFKFYKPLSLRRQLGYTILGTRARRAWIAARAFEKLEIPTPAPIALIESTRLGLISDRALLVTEHAPGIPLPEFVQSHLSDLSSLRNVAAQAAAIFSRFQQHRICHGDTNPRNFIVQPDQCLTVIDLDAVNFFVTPARWKSRLKKDQTLFSRLWRKNPQIAEIFQPAMGF